MVAFAIVVSLETPARESASSADLQVEFSHGGSGTEVPGQITNVAVWADQEIWHMSLLPALARLAL